MMERETRVTASLPLSYPPFFFGRREDATSLFDQSLQFLVLLLKTTAFIFLLELAQSTLVKDLLVSLYQLLCFKVCVHIVPLPRGNDLA